MRVRQKSGFTLLEIIIVIIIIAILASVAMPKLAAVRTYARVKEALGLIPLIRQEMDICYNSKNTPSYNGCTGSASLDKAKSFANNAVVTVAGGGASYTIKVVGNTPTPFPNASNVVYDSANQSIYGEGGLQGMNYGD